MVYFSAPVAERSGQVDGITSASTYDKMVQQAEKEKDERPAIKNTIKNISKYDTIYVGYQIWLVYHNLIQCTQA